MFDQARSEFAAKALGLSEEHKIIVASIHAQYVCEDELCKAVFGDDYDEEYVSGMVSGDEVSAALEMAQKCVSLPKGYMLVGLGLPSSLDNLTFGIVDFSEFESQ